MLKKLVCLIAVLGMASVVHATANWRDPSYAGGDGWNFNNNANWDEIMVPGPNGWRINRPGYSTGNLDVHVTADINTWGGTIFANAPYVATLTIDANKTLQMRREGGSAELIMEKDQSLIVKPGASLIMGPSFSLADQQINLGSTGAAYLKIESGGQAAAGYLRHDNGSTFDLYGTMRVWSVTRIDGVLNVYNNGLIWVESGIPAAGVGWAKGGKMHQYRGSTVQLQGDRTSYYLQLVTAGEPGGTWEVDYGVTRSGYTTIKYVPEPATALFLLAGLPLLRRRRA